jgi:rod shape determining protein RodA
MFDRHAIGGINWALFGFTLLLFGIGVLNLYSTSVERVEGGLSLSPFYQRQLLWGAVALGGMLLVMLVDYRHLKSLALPSYLGVIALLIVVLFAGNVVGGARRWIPLGFLSFQPSELAKIATMLLAARFLSQNKDPLDWFRYIQVIAVAAVPAMLILLQPDLGTTLILLLFIGGLMLFHGVRWNVLRATFLLLPILAFTLWAFMYPYQRDRVLTFLNPDQATASALHNTRQAQIAIGSGQMWGKGFLEGTQGSLQFLPARHTDFAIAVFAEEWGFVGCVLLLALFCFFLLAIYNTTKDAKDRFGSYICAGVFFYFFWQIFINIGMVLGLMPVVGIPLPFMSYGGTTTLVNFCMVGLVLNVSLRRFVFR